MTENPQDDARLMYRVRDVLANAVAGLDPQDRANRAAWCREHDAHGVRMHFANDDDLIEFRWGGKSLAMISRADLLSNEPLQLQFVAEDAPDTVPADWIE